MSRDSARYTPVRADRIATPLDDHIRQQMVHVREAFRLHRLARYQRRLQGLYDEHNMFAEAHGARSELMQLLRTARSSWRCALGLAP